MRVDDATHVGLIPVGARPDLRADAPAALSGSASQPSVVAEMRGRSRITVSFLRPTEPRQACLAGEPLGDATRRVVARRWQLQTTGHSG